MFLLILGIVGMIIFLATRDRGQPPRPSSGVSPKLSSEFFNVTPETEYRTERNFRTGEPFVVVIEGIYDLQGSNQNERYQADACYWRVYDSCPGQFSEPYRGVFFDGENNITPYAEDKYRHTFSCRYVGTGHALSLFVKAPRLSWQYSSGWYVRGNLSVTITPLSVEEDTTIRAREEAKRAEEEQRHKEERTRKEEEQRAKEEARRKAQEEEEKRRRENAEAALQQQLQELIAQYSEFPLYEEKEFIEQYAKTHTAELVRRKDPIIRAQVKFHQDTALIERLKEQAPNIYDRACFEVRSLALAERLAAAQPPPPLPRQRPTVEEVRARIVRRIQVDAEDKIASTKAKVDARFKVQKMLDEYPDLDSDERQQLESDLLEQILNQEVSRGPTTKETL
jgi:hypothetical protein